MIISKILRSIRLFTINRKFKKMQNTTQFADKLHQKYTGITEIIMIIQVIIWLIQTYQKCHASADNVKSELSNIKPIYKALLMRKIKRENKDMSREDRENFMRDLLSEINNMPDKDIQAIIDEHPATLPQ